eukprot:TRINITY_DN1579_c0_g1_i1.p1 TRINITY_DN1579_c0_g1~~TRINITY_DN1579_c0_g1_i1.p1  ORF type:complete len:106 (-),score=11.24 TRINITY_DN1579_c0_g1_i1:21-338(-)
MAIKSSRGAALVIVLFIVALASILAVEMSANLMVQVQRSTNIQGHQQAKWYAYAAEELAIKALLQVKKMIQTKQHCSKFGRNKRESLFLLITGQLKGLLQIFKHA